jgi:hypothetical protein
MQFSLISRVSILVVVGHLVACNLGNGNGNGKESVDDDTSSGGQSGSTLEADSGSGGTAGTTGFGGAAGAAGSNTAGQGGYMNGGTAGRGVAGTAGQVPDAGASAGAGAGASGAAGPPVVPSKDLFAWDDINVPTGDINPDKQFGRESGKGWSTGWLEGEHAQTGYYAVASDNPLRFSNLATSGNHMIHRAWDLGRNIDLSTPLLVPLVQSNQIAKAGTVVWLSVLVRLDTTNARSPIFITLHHGGLGYHFYGDTAWVAGAFPAYGINNWSLWTSPNANDPVPDAYTPKAEVLAKTHSSTKPIKVGVAHLVVVKVALTGGNSDKISMYIDPANLGGSEPAVADVTAMTGQSARFASFAFSGGGGDDFTQPAAFDEVRIGSSFAAVTPTR